MARHSRKKSPVSIPICLAIILLFLTLISIRLSSGIVARYSTTAGSSDSARVIQFGDISLTLTGGTTQYIAPGVELTWNADVTFEGSESATYVFLEVKPAGESCTVSADGMTYTLTPNGEPTVIIAQWKVVPDNWKFLKKTTDTNTYVYYCPLIPNKEMNNQALFSNSTVIALPTSNDELYYGKITNINATFRAGVVQSNGFNSVDDAWESLKKH